MVNPRIYKEEKEEENVGEARKIKNSLRTAPDAGYEGEDAVEPIVNLFM